MTKRSKKILKINRNRPDKEKGSDFYKSKKPAKAKRIQEVYFRVDQDDEKRNYNLPKEENFGDYEL